MRVVEDDLGRPVVLPGEPRRVVSLVPSLTETVAVTLPGVLVGATAWCTHPGDLDLRRVRGTKNPDLAAITELAPDLVLANEEENRPGDLDALQEAGLAVYVTRIRSVEEALASLARLLAACGAPDVPWLEEASAAWGAVEPVGARRLRALVPIWRRPWMALGRDTFAGDVLRRLGVDSVLGDSAERYPRFDPARVPDVDLVVLPDEPYAFSAADGPEAFPGVPYALVDGRSLTWYGPSLAAAPHRLRGLLSAATP
ncbi:MAG: helical backbone metal receptor [Actinomycetota bacterium]|nr:helical backbone metal receptor [Actinomycetota bacterium]